MIRINEYSNVDFAEWFMNGHYMQNHFEEPIEDILDRAKSTYRRDDLRRILNYYMRKTCAARYAKSGLAGNLLGEDVRKEFIAFLYSDQVGDYVTQLLRNRGNASTNYISITHTEKKCVAYAICEMFLNKENASYMSRGYRPQGVSYRSYYEYADTIFEYIAEVILSDAVYDLLVANNCLQAVDDDSFAKAQYIFKRTIYADRWTRWNNREYTQVADEPIYRYYVWPYVKEEEIWVAT